MFGIREEIIELRDAAARVSSDDWGARAAYLDAANELEWRDDQFNAIKQHVLSIANPIRDAKERERAELRRAIDSDMPLTARLWRKLERGDFDQRVPDPLALLEAGQAHRVFDLQDKLDAWRNELLANDLLPPDQARAINWTIPPYPGTLEKQRKEGEELQGLARAIQYYLAEVKAKHGWWGWRIALQTYNTMDEAPLSTKKVNDWRSALVAAKWLDAKHHPRGALGGLLERIIKGEKGQTA